MNQMTFKLLIAQNHRRFSDWTNYCRKKFRSYFTREYSCCFSSDFLSFFPFFWVFVVVVFILIFCSFLSACFGGGGGGGWGGVGVREGRPFLFWVYFVFVCFVFVLFCFRLFLFLFLK